MEWGFYGRSSEMESLLQILNRGRWFFARITGRRRIGKTTLVRRALAKVGVERTFYVQIPDSEPVGVLSTVAEAMEIFDLDPAEFPRPSSLGGLARLVETLARSGYIVALDEFQYFNRRKLFEFTSFLQAAVDRLSHDAAQVSGGLFVLGSIHADLVALLDDRHAPLYNRTTDEIELGHLDIASLLELLTHHADTDPERLLFLWNLFEGVPKFYRDCFEQGVLDGDRRTVLRQMFFRSSSPLRTEADNWFLKELHGRYDAVLKFVARHPGCMNGDVVSHLSSIGAPGEDQASGYLQQLIERFGMLERRQPIFAKPKARRGRYYVRDNFLRSWLSALSNPVATRDFRPEDELIQKADRRLRDAEGHGLERLVKQLYAERSRKGLPGFSLSHQIEGYWDRADTEIDLIALDEVDERIRFGTCKRASSKLVADLERYDGHIERFLNHHRQYRGWHVERVAIAPHIESTRRAAIEAKGYQPQDLVDLTADLLPEG